MNSGMIYEPKRAISGNVLAGLLNAPARGAKLAPPGVASNKAVFVCGATILWTHTQ